LHPHEKPKETLPPGYTMSGVRELVREMDYPRLKRLADEHMPHVVVSLDWQAPGHSDLERELRDRLGTIFGVEEIGGAVVQRLAEEDVERNFRATLASMLDEKFRLWLDHGYASRVVEGPDSAGIIRIESDDKYHLQFRVRPEGKPVGSD